ncbi:hypothetical protein KC19_11G091000 [Ceratodon purpureus]|uniref:RNA-dependent RNA polymerase n=1 Tax=Ceratodon purpureus TaxID=3225 RepID=A0A8T0GD81_CERPU|nr:hypothetical protein KC19_11G091000 [Ceratodon purpureus]
MDQNQVMVGNFPWDVRAQDLATYLQRVLGIVDRCKVKRTSGKTPPHAFVQFVSGAVAREACSESDRGNLSFEGCVLKIIPCTSIGAGSKPSHGAGPIELRKAQLQLGTLTSLYDLLLSWRVPEYGCSLRVNKKMRKISLFFSHEKIMSANSQDKELCEFKLEFSVRDVRQVKEVQTQRGRMPELMMILQLWSPPLISYRTSQGDDVYCATHTPLPDDDDPWIRTIDFTPHRSIGRCLAYVISVSPTEGTPFRQLLQFFRLQRLCDGSPPRRLNMTWEETTYSARQNYFFVPDRNGVPFELMFLVNALVHRGIINTTSLTDEFYRTILTDYALSTYALQHMNTYSHPVFDAVTRIQRVKEWARKYDKVKGEEKVLPSGCMMVHRVILTPTRAYCAHPVREMSNRVLRHFHMLSDRFLRVTFLDDDLHQVPSSALTVPVSPIVRSMSTTLEFNRTELYKRVLNIVKTGFTLCGRKYEFLAFSSSQLRDASAWFFAGNSYVNAHHIRRWMGQFPTQNVAKFAARMGQCFSSTFITLAVPKERVMLLPDVHRNGYIFSDGCGRIAPKFALQVSESLKLDHTPSLYQIRYAGCKGVVATWPMGSSQGHQYDLGVRDSMNKFHSDHTELEVVGWSKYLPCYLNRQIICLLSTLQVENSAFKSLQDAQVVRLEAMLEDPSLAYEVLTSSCTGDVHSTAATMLQGGFHPKNEPHLYDMLLSIRTSQLEDLIAKARIYVPNGRWLMGCMDETGLLNYGQCFIQVSGPVKKASLGGDGFNQQHRSGPLQVITGKVIMAKNPCLHPGDIRILEAVDVPQLHSMVDCLVVPQNGDRPHPNEASGSDLDGDVYFTCWDSNLIPPSGCSWDPMNYNAHEQKLLSRPAKIEDVMEFFVKAMINDSLGVICNAHVVHADRSPLGALDENCLLLAQLAATAVDFPKTGKAATMPHYLRIKEFPDFMEKDESVTYQSDKIIGELYRSVTKFVKEEVDKHRHADHAEIPVDPAYDSDLQVPGYEQYLEDAWATKVLYDQNLRGIMSHFNVKREADVITGRMNLQSRGSSRQKSDLKERMIHAYAALCKEFQAEFYKSASEYASVKSSSEESMVAAESNSELENSRLLDITPKLASAWYHVTYNREWKQKALDLLNDTEDAGARPLLSFAWIAAPILAKIKYMKLQESRQGEALAD